MFVAHNYQILIGGADMANENSCAKFEVNFNDDSLNRRRRPSPSKTGMLASVGVAVLAALSSVPPAAAQLGDPDDGEIELSAWIWSVSSGTVTADTGTSISIDFKQYGSVVPDEGAQAVFSALTNLPGGLTLTPQGVLSGTVPTTIGTYTIGISGSAPGQTASIPPYNLTLEVLPVYAPIARDDSATTAYETLVAIDAFANDDPGADGEEYSLDSFFSARQWQRDAYWGR